MTLYPLVSSIGRYAIPHFAVAETVGWPSNNLILYVPVRIPEDTTVKRLFWANGNAVSGNVECGLYQGTTRLFTSGTQTQTTTNVLQFTNITDQPIDAGLYYMALQLASTSGRIVRASPGTAFLTSQGVMSEAAGGFGLPATATFVKYTAGFLPAFGLDLRG